MQKNIYLWVEDRVDKAGFTFWKTMMEQLFPNVIVESKTNNSELIKAVQNLSDHENKYIVAFDQVFDNIQVVREHQLLQTCIRERRNVYELRLICFEYVLLEFEYLLDWIYAPHDEFIQKRAVAITAREKLIAAIRNQGIDYKQIKELQEYHQHLDTMNIEQLVARLLFDLTRNTGFEVNKSLLGTCWVTSCCEWKERRKDDVCGLDTDRMSLYEKMKTIWENTALKEEFCKAGLGASE